MCSDLCMAGERDTFMTSAQKGLKGHGRAVDDA